MYIGGAICPFTVFSLTIPTARRVLNFLACHIIFMFCFGGEAHTLVVHIDLFSV